MRVKRYVVETMPEAMQRIRNELGKDAVILNTKEFRTGGFFGLFGKKRIEVIAATDSAVSVGSTGAVSISAERNNASAGARVKAQAASSEISASQAAVGILDGPDAGLEKEKLREDRVLQELRYMKDTLNQWTLHQKALSATPTIFQPMEERLLVQEVDPVIVQQLLNRAQEAAGQLIDQLTPDQALGLVKKELRQLIHQSSEKKLSGETKIAHFVGPTGVGKTTTIAKLAAEQVLKFNRKVGFITSDTYRIAAVEQLKTYATILNVPLEVVYSPQELNKAFQNLKDCDIIFMDTAGRNYRNAMYVSELNTLLQANGKSETYLVLSLASKYKDMKIIAENFKRFKLDKLLFTKIDETDTYGAIANLSYNLSIPFSYITNGQNVPNDIAELNEDNIVNLLLEEQQNG